MLKSKADSIKIIIFVTLLALLSEFFGFLRDVLIAYRYGTGTLSDTYFAVAGITILLFNLIVNSMITTVIPVLAEVELAQGKSAKIRYTGLIFTLIGIISFGLVVLVELFSPLIIRLIATGFSAEQFELAVKLLRLGIPGIIFSATVGVLAGFLQSEGKYYASSAMRIAFNLTCIIYLFLFADNFGIEGLMIASVIGTMAQFLFLQRDLKLRDYKYQFSLTFSDQYFKKILHLSLPVFLGIAIYDINTMLDRSFASTLSIGNVSQLTYANKIETLLISIFVSAITTVAYPEISRKVAEQDKEGLKQVFKSAINICLLIAIPASFGLIIFGQPIVQVLYQRGQFSAESSLNTARILTFYSLGLIGKSIREVVVRVFYAMQENRKTLNNGLLTVLLNLIMNFAILNFAKVELLALTTSIAIFISSLLLLYQLRKKIGELGLRRFIITTTKSMVAASIMALLSSLMFEALLRKIDATANGPLFLILAFTVFLAVCIYFGLAYFFKIEEVRDLAGLIINKLRNNQADK